MNKQQVTAKQQAEREALVQAVANGTSIAAACRAVGKTRNWYYDLIKTHPELRQAVDAAREVAIGALYSDLYLDARGNREKVTERHVREKRDGDKALIEQVVEERTREVWHRPSIGAAAIWLRRHDPQFVERHEGTGDAPEDAARKVLAAMAELSAATEAEPPPENTEESEDGPKTGPA